METGNVVWKEVGGVAVTEPRTRVKVCDVGKQPPEAAFYYEMKGIAPGLFIAVRIDSFKNVLQHLLTL